MKELQQVVSDHSMPYTLSYQGMAQLITAINQFHIGCNQMQRAISLLPQGDQIAQDYRAFEQSVKKLESNFKAQVSVEVNQQLVQIQQQSDRLSHCLQNVLVQH